MKFVNRILKKPIKDTLVLLGIVLLAFIILYAVGVLLGRLSLQDFIGSDQPNIMLTLLRGFVWDFVYISRLIAEVTFVVLIAQIVYRFVKK